MHKSRITSVLLVAGFSGFIGGALSSRFIQDLSVLPQDEMVARIQAKRFELVDDSGTVKAALATTPRTHLTFYTRDGTAAVSLFLDSSLGSAGLETQLKEGNFQLEAGKNWVGEPGYPRFRPSLTLTTPQGQSTVLARGFEVRDADGKEIASLIGGRGLQLFDRNHKSHAMLGVGGILLLQRKPGVQFPAILITNSQGEGVWDAP